MFVFPTACDFDINIIIIMNLIVDAAKDKVFLKIITNKQSYTNEYSNTKENFDKMGIIIFDFLKKITSNWGNKKFICKYRTWKIFKHKVIDCIV